MKEDFEAPKKDFPSQTLERRKINELDCLQLGFCAKCQSKHLGFFFERRFPLTGPVKRTPLTPLRYSLVSHRESVLSQKSSLDFKKAPKTSKKSERLQQKLEKEPQIQDFYIPTQIFTPKQ